MEDYFNNDLVQCKDPNLVLRFDEVSLQHCLIDLATNKEVYLGSYTECLQVIGAMMLGASLADAIKDVI